MFSLIVKLFGAAILLFPSYLAFVPLPAPTAAPISKKPTSSPTYQISDCTTTACSVYYGSSFLVSPNSISARVYLPTEFTLSFGLRRPILSAAGNNIIQLRAADATLDSESLLTFSMDSQGVSNTVYNGNLLQAAGVVADYVNTYTTFTLTFSGRGLLVQSSADPNTVTARRIPYDAVVNTTSKLFYVYTSAPGSKDAITKPLLQSFTLGGKHSSFFITVSILKCTDLFFLFFHCSRSAISYQCQLHFAKVRSSDCRPDRCAEQIAQCGSQCCCFCDTHMPPDRAAECYTQC